MTRARRHDNLWAELTGFRNLLRAFEQARRGKRRHENVAAFEVELERELFRLQDELRGKTYAPGPYRTFQICEPKPRLISAAPFRDRVVHHALCRVLVPIFEPTFLGDSYACRVGKGTHAAVDRFVAFARRCRYVLKCDVAKYFPSIDHEILKGQIARKVTDRDVLWLANRIIDASNAQEEVREWFPGDDLFAPGGRRRGLPLGNQTSQFFANVYLSPLDHFIKEVLRAPCYLRYVDDFLLLSDDKGWLAEARERCREFLAGLRLRLHPRKAAVSRVADGTRLLGYRVWPTHRLLPRANVTRMRRRLRRLRARGDLKRPAARAALAGWWGHAR
ncbi:MAG TPA: RNA-directed DNA polymerase, partial [Gemmataceae bacterium]|nr:RNA-directed DNA polymerase [Gemmataceae bacterium]